MTIFPHFGISSMRAETCSLLSSLCLVMGGGVHAVKTCCYLSLSEGFGGCSRKPTWQELREGLESRNKGRRRPGATGALTALGALFLRKQEEGHITADVVPGKWTPAASRVSPGNRLQDTGWAQHTVFLPGPGIQAFQSRPHPLGLKGTLVDTCRPLPWAPRRAY